MQNRETWLTMSQKVWVLHWNTIYKRFTSALVKGKLSVFGLCISAFSYLKKFEMLMFRARAAAMAVPLLCLLWAGPSLCQSLGQVLSCSERVFCTYIIMIFVLATDLGCLSECPHIWVIQSSGLHSAVLTFTARARNEQVWSNIWLGRKSGTEIWKD